VCVLPKSVGAVHLDTMLLLCVSYCNVMVQYSCVQGYCGLCVILMSWCSTVGYRVTVVCYCNVFGAVQLGTDLLLCVCYCNVLVQYIWVEGYSCVCVNVKCWCSTVGYRVTVVCALM